MKKFMVGLLVGIMVSLSVTILAANFQAITADFKILINGKEWSTDKPIVTINDSTYLPLRAVGDALGVKVNWNSELNRVEIGDAPVEQANYSRSNPAPLNTVQKIDIDRYTEKYSAAVRVLETHRGNLALGLLKNISSYTYTPDEGCEFIVAKIAISILSIDGDKSIDVNQYKFNCFSSNNEQYDKTIISILNPELSGQLFAGGNAEGYTIFQVKKDDSAPKIVYEQNYDGSGGIWFNLK